jgi:hypothetical protein
MDRMEAAGLMAAASISLSIKLELLDNTLQNLPMMC